MIPNTFHFCFGLRAAPRFGFLEYLALKSAFDVNRPDAMLMHCAYVPEGPWWERARGLVTINRIRCPSRIFGRPLQHYAHRADVVRLQVLKEYGGIYLDIDTLCLRSFTPLLNEQCVMGRQRGRGLCNAVIMSERGGRFVSAWLNNYRTFRAKGRDDHWDEHSVRLPWRMALRPRLRNSITVLNSRAFFFPLWHEMHHLFEADRPEPFAHSYCIHYWETLTREKWLTGIRYRDASRGRSAFWAFARRFL